MSLVRKDINPIICKLHYEYEEVVQQIIDEKPQSKENLKTIIGISELDKINFKNFSNQEELKLRRICEENFLEFTLNNFSKLVEQNLQKIIDKNIRNTLSILTKYNILNTDTSIPRVTAEYLNVKEYIDKETNSDFYVNFSHVYSRVTESQLDYTNEQISSGETENKLSLVDLQEIKNLSFTIEKLQDIKITTSSYKKGNGGVEVDYQLFVNKALKEYGIILSNKIPFSNPTQLFVKIESILRKANLNKSQRSSFWDEIFFRKRSPNQKEVKDILNKLNYNEIQKNLNDKFYSLSHEEQTSFIQNKDDFKSSSRCFEIFESLENIRIMDEIISFSFSPPSTKELEEVDEYNYSSKIINLKYMESLFLRYPHSKELENISKN